MRHMAAVNNHRVDRFLAEFVHWASEQHDILAVALVGYLADMR